MTKTTWTPEMKQTAIDAQWVTIAHRATPMAVVDYGLGWRRTGATSRFGTRDLHHVRMYGLTVVALNHAAALVSQG